MGLGLAGVREAAVSRRRDPVTGAEVLHEALGPLQRRGRRRGAEGLDAGRGQPVDQAQDQRLLRPDHDEVDRVIPRSEEHTSELQSLMRISYAVFCLKKKKTSN